jgi:hypothetical protein
MHLFLQQIRKNKVFLVRKLFRAAVFILNHRHFSQTQELAKSYRIENYQGVAYLST